MLLWSLSFPELGPVLTEICLKLVTSVVFVKESQQILTARRAERLKHEEVMMPLRKH